MQRIKNYLLITIGLSIAACSGDDEPVDKGPVVVEPEVKTGVFLDSEVGGLTYTTDTRSGTTNSSGEFEYLEGETVTFSVGDIELGSAEASGEMTPVTIASTPNATVATKEVMNIAALLQTLDSDNDPSNGILIEAAVANAISTSSIDFTSSIVQLLGEITAEVNQATGSNLVPVYPEEAATHLAETVGEKFEPEDYVFQYAIPTIESWTSYPRTSLHWIHETDESGKLVKSYMYERFPYRVLSEYTYLEHNEFGQPIKYEQEFFFRNGSGSQTSTRELVYNEDHRIAGLQYFSADGTKATWVEFSSYNEYGRVAEARNYDNEGNFLFREIYVSNEAGNNLTKSRYSSESGTNEADLVENTTFEYTAFGDLDSRSIVHQTYGLQEWEYFYRDNNTLEEAIRSSVDLHGRPRTDHYHYDENEVTNRLVITVGDYVSDYVDFYDNGDAKRVETYYKGFLYEIVEWNEDRSSVWTTINEEDGSYKMEYKDADGNILKTEYYDAEGNLLSTDPA